MKIEKMAMNREKYYIETKFYNSARDCFGDILDYFNEKKNIQTIFIPAYIGVSPKEGSGLYDPLKKRNNYRLEFYKMNRDLTINTYDLKNRISNLNGKFLFLLVNYFGFIDPNVKKIISFIKNRDGYIIEDNAHAFYTYENQKSRISDISFFSLHKQFPFKNGGMLKIHNNDLISDFWKGKNYPQEEYNFYNYDKNYISKKIITNYKILQKKIIQYKDLIEILRPNLNNGIVPQSFPILIKKGDRYTIYRILNEQGYGVTSLYHTMIEPIRLGDYEDSKYVSSKILNLPIHQDVDPNSYEDMLKFLIEIIKNS